MTTKKRLRWKREKHETGLRRMVSPEPGWKLHDGESEFASVWTPARYGNQWYWSTQAQGSIPRFNSYPTFYTDPAEAKADALAYVKRHMGEHDV